MKNKLIIFICITFFKHAFSSQQFVDAIRFSGFGLYKYVDNIAFFDKFSIDFVEMGVIYKTGFGFGISLYGYEKNYNRISFSGYDMYGRKENFDSVRYSSNYSIHKILTPKLYYYFYLSDHHSLSFSGSFNLLRKAKMTSLKKDVLNQKYDFDINCNPWSANINMLYGFSIKPVLNVFTLESGIDFKWYNTKKLDYSGYVANSFRYHRYYLALSIGFGGIISDTLDNNIGIPYISSKVEERRLANNLLVAYLKADSVWENVNKSDLSSIRNFLSNNYLISDSLHSKICLYLKPLLYNELYAGKLKLVINKNNSYDYEIKNDIIIKQLNDSGVVLNESSINTMLLRCSQTPGGAKIISSSGTIEGPAEDLDEMVKLHGIPNDAVFIKNSNLSFDLCFSEYNFIVATRKITNVSKSTLINYAELIISALNNK